MSIVLPAGTMSVELAVGISGLALGVAGVIFGVYVYFRPRKRLRLIYQRTDKHHFDQARLALPREAAMTYRDAKVERLATSALFLWNAGTDVLRGEDIVELDPLRVSVEEGQVLRYRIACMATAATGLSLEEDAEGNDEIQIGYDHLNPGDGALIVVVHDGSAVRITGRVKGIRHGAEDLGPVPPDRPSLRVWFQDMTLGTILPSIIFPMMWISLSVKAREPLTNDVGYMLLGAWVGTVIGLTVHRTRRRWLAPRPPKTLMAARDD